MATSACKLVPIAAAMQLGNGGKRDALGPPLDKDGNDWNEGAFQYEIMSEYFSSCDEAQCPLSSVTLGTLQDIGYNVEYSMTDTNYMPYLGTVKQ